MTTTVQVKARAHGALVAVVTVAEGEEGHAVNTEDHELGSFEERTFHLEKGQRVEVREGNAPEPESLDKLFSDEEERKASETGAVETGKMGKAKGAAAESGLELD